MVNQVTQQPVQSQTSAALAAGSYHTPLPPKATDGGSVAKATNLPNPSFQFDAAAGIVVIQFRSAGGKIEVSIPNQQQLKAYANPDSNSEQASGAPVIA